MSNNLSKYLYHALNFFSSLFLTVSKKDKSSISEQIIKRPKTFTTPHKNLIRKNWNKPLLKFLSKKEGQNLVYMGLPSPEAEDLNDWIEYIDSVIAFQCRDHKHPSSPEQSREQVEKLENYLRDLERKNKINNYVVYDGYLEEVVLRGYDNSPNVIDFRVGQFITLYNLDFCNKVSTPITYVDKKGNAVKAFKFEAIGKLLDFQKSISSISKKFVLFLTVHCSYDGRELQDFIQNPKSEEIKNTIAELYGLSTLQKKERIIRLFVSHLVKVKYEASGFTPKILPVIRYEGIGKTPLLHFAIFGIHKELNGGDVRVYQTLSEILKERFVNIEEETFVNAIDSTPNEVEVNVNPVEYFVESKTFKKLWN
jgi:hypothetical protein